MKDLWQPIDIISVILILAAVALKLQGLNGDVSLALLAIVVHYYGTAHLTTRQQK